MLPVEFAQNLLLDFKKAPKIENCPKKIEFDKLLNERKYRNRKDYYGNEIVFNRVDLFDCKSCEFLYGHFEDEEYIQCFGKSYSEQ